MRRFVRYTSTLALLVAITCFASAAHADMKYDLSLWRLFTVNDIYKRGDVTFGKVSILDTTTTPDLDGTALLVTITDKDGVKSFWVWYNGKYVRWNALSDPASDATSKVTLDRLDSTQTLEFKADQRAFRTFLKKWGALWAPSFMSPAESLGQAGWDVGVETSLAFTFNPKTNAWADAFAGTDRLEGYFPDDTMSMIRVRLRKGLPFSTELGASVTYLIDSRMLSIGTALKVAVYEGYDYAPDVSLRFTYDHVFGSPDLTTHLFGGDLGVSYSIGIAGVLELTPYTGYSLTVAHATVGVQNASFHTIVANAPTLTDTVTGSTYDFSSNYDGALLHFSPETVLLHRWYLGLRMVVASFNLTLENILTAENNTFTIKVGAEF